MIRTKTLLSFVLVLLMTEAKIPIFVNLPLDAISADGKLVNGMEFDAAFQELKKNGIDGIIADVWWSSVEKTPRVYDFTAYIELLDIIKRNDLRAKFILSFHECGSSFGDDCNIPLPDWVLVQKHNDVFYKDSSKEPSYSYISLFADNERLFGHVGIERTPLEIYRDFMLDFKRQFETELDELIDEIYVGLGPSGQLRYPAYRVERNSFCGVGDFQNFDIYALRSLEQAKKQYAESLASKEVYKLSNSKPLGYNTFDIVFERKNDYTYVHKPHETKFFTSHKEHCNVHPFQKEECFYLSSDQCESNGCCWDSAADIKCFKESVDICPTNIFRTDCGYYGIKENECINRGCCWNDSKQGIPFCFTPTMKTNYQTPYGQFFMDWYQEKLFEHAENIISSARDIFPYTSISVKIPSIYWLHHDSSRAAEATTGYNHTKGQNPYKKLMIILNKYKVGMLFSGFELLDSDVSEECMASPEALLNEVKTLSKEMSVELSGEPTITNVKKKVRFEVAAEQIDGLRAFIPFRALRRTGGVPRELQDIIEKTSNYEPTNHFKLKKLKRLIIVILMKNCKQCIAPQVFKY